MNHNHYYEEQRFTNLRWLWIAVLIALLIPLVTLSLTDADYLFTLQTTGLVLLGLIPILAILNYSRLYVKIDSEGLHYQLFPAIWKWRKINKKDIASMESINEPSLLEKIIIGHQRNLFTNTIRMNITGTTFLRLNLVNGKKIIIGSKNADEMIKVLKKITPVES